MMTMAINSACVSGGGISPAHPAADVLHAEVVSGRTPAVQYRHFSRDSVLFAFDEGLADIARGVPVDSATTFNVFSVTKTFTALAVLQMAEQGKLQIDGRAADYLPGFPYSRDISIRDLLTHSAGIPNPIPLRWVHLQEEHGSVDRDTFFRDLFAQNRKLRSKPNERFAYSNLGYVLLGEIIEHASGLRYEQYVTENILVPIGLSPHDLGFAIDDAVHARGYHRRMSMSYVALGFLMDRKKYVEPGAGPWRAFRLYNLNGVSYGGLIGTADALVSYVQALLDPQSGLVSEESRRLLFTENVLSSGKPSGMSLSWFRGELNGHTYYAHAGGGGGYYAEVRIYPELQRGSVILFNRSGMTDQRFLDRVDKSLTAFSSPRAAGEVIWD
jgi:D-alanyl-D-alanine carboxypeptidase